jgi:hypothetical protein
MKKTQRNKEADDLRPEYDLTKLGPGVRGKYYHQATAGINLVVLIDPNVEEVLPADDAANRGR